MKSINPLVQLYYKNRGTLISIDKDVHLSLKLDKVETELMGTD